jgi:hypothetical protein
MFEKLTLRGPRAAIKWGGYRDAATLSAWAITRARDERGQVRWTLQAALTRVDQFVLSQRPLLFVAPRTGRVGGFWLWPVQEMQIGTTTVRANLGPPEF